MNLKYLIGGESNAQHSMLAYLAFCSCMDSGSLDHLSINYINPASSSCRDSGWLDHMSIICISPASSSCVDAGWLDHLSSVPITDYSLMLIGGTTRL